MPKRFYLVLFCILIISCNETKRNSSVFSSTVTGQGGTSSSDEETTAQANPTATADEETNRACIEAYLSPALPEGHDFFFKNQASVKTLRDLYFLSDGSFLKQTGGGDRLEVLERNLGMVELVHLIEKALASKLNLNEDLPSEKNRRDLVSGIITGRAIQHNQVVGETYFPLLQQYILYSEHTRSEHHNSQNPTHKEQMTRILEGMKEELQAHLTEIEKALSSSLIQSIQNIASMNNCPNFDALKTIEKNFELIEEELIVKKTGEVIERLKQLNEEEEVSREEDQVSHPKRQGSHQKHF